MAEEAEIAKDVASWGSGRPDFVHWKLRCRVVVVKWCEVVPDLVVVDGRHGFRDIEPTRQGRHTSRKRYFYDSAVIFERWILRSSRIGPVHVKQQLH